MNIGSPHAEEKEGGLQKGEEVGAVVARHAHAIAEGLAKPRDRNKALITCTALLKDLWISLQGSTQTNRSEGSIVAHTLLGHGHLKPLSRALDTYFSFGIAPLLEPGVAPSPASLERKRKIHNIDFSSLVARTSLVVQVLLGDKTVDPHPQLRKLAADRYLTLLWSALLQLTNAFTVTQSDSAVTQSDSAVAHSEKAVVQSDSAAVTASDRGFSETDRLEEWMRELSVVSPRGTIEALFLLLTPSRATEACYNPPPRPAWLKSACRLRLSLSLMQPGGISTLCEALISSADPAHTPKLALQAARAISSPSAMLRQKGIGLEAYIKPVAKQLVEALSVPPGHHTSSSGAVSAYVQSIFALIATKPVLVKRLVIEPTLQPLLPNHKKQPENREARSSNYSASNCVIFLWRITTAYVRVPSEKIIGMFSPGIRGLVGYLKDLRRQQTSSNSLEGFALTSLSTLISLAPSSASGVLVKVIAEGDAKSRSIVSSALKLTRKGTMPKIVGKLLLYSARILNSPQIYSHKGSHEVESLAVGLQEIILDLKSTLMEGPGSTTVLSGVQEALRASAYVDKKQNQQRNIEEEISRNSLLKNAEKSTQNYPKKSVVAVVKVCVGILEATDPSILPPPAVSLLPSLISHLKSLNLTQSPTLSRLSRALHPQPKIGPSPAPRMSKGGGGGRECEWEKGLEEAGRGKSVPVRAHGLASLRKLVDMGYIPKGRDIPSENQDWFEAAMRVASQGMGEGDSFVFENAIALMAALSAHRPGSSILRLAYHFRNSRLGYQFRLKVAEVINTVCERYRKQAKSIPFDAASDLMSSLLSVAEIEVKKKDKGSKIDIASMKASSLSTLADAISLFPSRLTRSQGGKVGDVVIEACSDQEAPPEVRRASFFLLERFFEALGQDTTQVLKSEQLSKIYDLLQKARVRDFDAAVRVLAGRAMENLGYKVLR
ncbi:hypothetical protein AAMO2058_000607000 [Amorphochlora amoebiformis]